MRKLIVISMCFIACSCEGEQKENVYGSDDAYIDNRVGPDEYIIVKDINGNCYSMSPGNVFELYECECE